MNMKFSFIKLIGTTLIAVALVAGVTMFIGKVAGISGEDAELYYVMAASSLGCIAYIPWLALNYDFFDEVCERLAKTLNNWGRKKAEKYIIK